MAKDTVKYISVKDAILKAREKNIKVSKPTVIKIVTTHGLGHQLLGKGSNWHIDEVKWGEYLDGKNKK